MLSGMGTLSGGYFHFNPPTHNPQVPEGCDWASLLGNAMEKYNVEIAGGLGPTIGQIFRVGLLGFNAKPANVELVLAAFRDGLKKQGIAL